MASDGSAENFIHNLKESIRHLEGLHSLTDEQTELVNKLIRQIRSRLAELDGE